MKGLVPHNNVYNFTRFQDVWRDKYETRAPGLA